MSFACSGELWFWRGPSPFHFVTVPDDVSGELRAMVASVTYGWGMIPVTATLDDVTFSTSLFPHGEGYIIPVKQAVRQRTGVSVGDEVTIVIEPTPRP